MPELPEVETVRRSLEPTILGARILDVRLVRHDIVTGPHQPSDLLAGCVVRRLERLGKTIAIIAADTASRAERAVTVHLGMTGQLCALVPGHPQEHADHVHLLWIISRRSKTPHRTLIFRDPRRFGRIRTFRTLTDLKAHLDTLGPDALTAHDAPRLFKGRSPIKAALLDQARIAGVGNIYADESLFRAGIHPRLLAGAVSPASQQTLLAAVRTTLEEAVLARGSSLRDYVDSEGQPGSFQLSHRVYGRGGQPCVQCGLPLKQVVIAQRTSVFCPRCQIQRKNKSTSYPQTPARGGRS